MPKTVNDSLFDEYTKHSVNLMRLEASLERKSIRLLKKLEKELVQKLKLVDPTDVEAESYRVRRMQKLLEQVKETINSAYSELGSEIRSELVELGYFESQFNTNAINTAINAEVMTVGLTRPQLKGIVKSSLVRGAVMRDWVTRLGARTRVRFQDEMRMGVMAGEPLQDLVVRVRGSAIPGKPGLYTGGIISTSTNEARTLARTAVQTISGNVRESVLKENQNLLKGLEALVTLDLRTSDICRPRSKMAWDFDGNPLPGTNTTIQYPGSPPWHWNCRTTLIPVLKSLGELGARTRVKVPESTQASMDGQIAESKTYEDWLRGQRSNVQRDVLGATRYEMWKAGKIKSFRGLIDQRGRPLTVAELQDRYG